MRWQKPAFDEGRYHVTISVLEACIEWDATYAPCHRLLGDAYVVTERPSQAMPFYRRYLELAPTAEDAADVEEILRYDGAPP